MTLKASVQTEARQSLEGRRQKKGSVEIKILPIKDWPFVAKLFARRLAMLGFTEAVGHGRAHDALTFLETKTGAASPVFCNTQMPVRGGASSL